MQQCNRTLFASDLLRTNTAPRCTTHSHIQCTTLSRVYVHWGTSLRYTSAMSTSHPYPLQPFLRTFFRYSTVLLNVHPYLHNLTNHSKFLQGQKKILTLKGTDLDSKLAGSVLVTLPSKGTLYKSDGIMPLSLNSKNATSTLQSKQLYSTGYYRNSTYEVAYRTDKTFSLSSQSSLSKNDTAMGVISRDSFYFALQDIEGMNTVM
jgi:hypothetical protein